jgi:putative transposase
VFRHDRWAELFVSVLYGYRPERFLLHGFVVMPDHFHLLITPTKSLERVVQCVKGSFSFKAKRDFSWTGDIWVAGFSDHRIRDLDDYRNHEKYIANNPVDAKLAVCAEEFRYSSASGRFELDEIPLGLKPQSQVAQSGAAEAAPFQSELRDNSSISKGL